MITLHEQPHTCHTTPLCSRRQTVSALLEVQPQRKLPRIYMAADKPVFEALVTFALGTSMYIPPLFSQRPR
jgi:hypothetical protein